MHVKNTKHNIITLKSINIFILIIKLKKLDYVLKSILCLFSLKELGLHIGLF